MMFRFPSVICTRCTGFFCLAIIKGPPNDIYCIIEEPYKHYFTEKVSYSRYYNLDAIIAVGYRVNSKKATMFRIWANRVLKEFIIKGYVIKSLNLLLFPSVLPIILASSI